MKNSKCWINRFGAIAAVVCLLFVAAGCTGDPDDDPTFLGNGNNNDSDAGPDADATEPGDTDKDPDADAGPQEDGDAGPGDDSGDAGDVGPRPDVDENNNNNEDPDDPAEVSGPCGPMLELGELVWGEQSIEVDFDYFDNELTTQCDSGIAGDAAILAFSAPTFETGVLQVDTGGETNVELRSWTCDNEDSSVQCYEDDTAETALGPGVEYYLVMEPLSDNVTSPLDVTLSFEEMATCEPEDAEQKSCVDESWLQACQVTVNSPDIPRELVVECPSGECADDQCSGDTCSAPIAVTSSFEWAGRTLGFSNHHNNSVEIDQAADDEVDPTCLDEDAASPITSTEGREMVFELQDLSEGDQVQIDIDFERPDNLTVFIKDSCSQDTACQQVWQGEDSMVFDAPGDGNYFLIVDSLFDIDGFIDIAIEISNP